MARLPQPLQSHLERAARAYFEPPAGLRVDFTAPKGAPALIAPDSISWRVMKNPIALFVGGIAAVILELAEPRVRSGVWDHTSFRRDPVTRMKRTGFAAMTTIYAPADDARAMIAAVVRAHDRVEGSPAGVAYCANEPELLNWVQTTASYGFIKAYRRFVHPVSNEDLDRFYAEAKTGAALFGADQAPSNVAEVKRLITAMRPKLERSQIIFDFLDIVRRAPILPSRSVQRLLVRAAIDITPTWARDILGIPLRHALQPGGDALMRALGVASDHIVIETAPPSQSCVRLNLPADYLYR